jgi:hypothetical protein
MQFDVVVVVKTVFFEAIKVWQDNLMLKKTFQILSKTKSDMRYLQSKQSAKNESTSFHKRSVRTHFKVKTISTELIKRLNKP